MRHACSAAAALLFNTTEEDEQLCWGILSSIHLFHHSLVEDAAAYHQLRLPYNNPYQ